MKRPKYEAYDLIAFHAFDKSGNPRYFLGTIASVNIPSDDENEVTYDMSVCDPRLNNGNPTICKGINEDLIVGRLNFFRVISMIEKDRKTMQDRKTIQWLYINNNGELSVCSG